MKGLDSKLSQISNGIVASVTTLDGRHGNIGELFNSIQCSASGVTKSYSFEQNHLRTRALDLHPEIVLDAPHAAEVIVNDIINIGGEVEIGIDRDGRRWTLVAFDEKLEATREPLTSTDTWIVSGGGSGVTAASIIGVAQASTDANAHFVLLGRSQLIEETQTWIDWNDEQLNTRKMALKNLWYKKVKMAKLPWLTGIEIGRNSPEVEMFTLHSIESRKQVTRQNITQLM